MKNLFIYYNLLFKRLFQIEYLIFSALIIFTNKSIAEDGFNLTGSMNIGRVAHSAAVLNNGVVLIAGGANGENIIPDAELYDPETGLFEKTGSLNEARMYYTLTLLPNGNVIAVGGILYENHLSSCEIYNPVTKKWTKTGSLNVARMYHTATPLADGNILVCGGNNRDPLSSAELYNPETGVWTLTGSLNNSRTYHTGTLLNNGNIIAIGGGNSGGQISSAEIYNVKTGRWLLTGSMLAPRQSHSAINLKNGKILVTGGYKGGSVLSSSELYDPDSNAFTLTGSLNNQRIHHTTTLLKNGTVLAVGGPNAINTELYNSDSGNWIATKEMKDRRFLHTAVRLSDEIIMIAGGQSPVNNESQSSVELYYTGLPNSKNLVLIKKQPLNVTVDIGEKVSFSLEATNALTYQWFKDGNALPSATNSNLSLPNASPAMIGDYFAVASNVSGTATSSVASLIINGVDSGIWKGLVAYYPFNGNANDESGNGNNSSAQGNYNYAKDGLRGSAFRAIGDGSQYYAGGGHALLPRFDSKLNSGFTMSIWVKDEIKGPAPAADIEQYLCFDGDNDRSGLGITAHDGMVIWSMFAQNPYVNGEYRLMTNMNSFFLQGWRQLVFTYKPGEFSCYLNGQMVYRTDATVNAFPVSRAALNRHWWSSGGASSARMSCTYDEVRIYNCTLTEEDVKALYAYESTPPNPVSIASHPQNITTDLTKDVSFSVTATNALTYQWFKDGNALPSATNSFLALTNAQPAMIGDYFAAASNAYGTATSSVASLNIKGVDSGIWKGLVAYYPFDGGLADAVGLNGNGINHGATLISDRFGVAEHAYYFDGNNDSVEIPAGVAFLLKNYTISFWVRSDRRPVNGGDFIISRGRNVMEFSLGCPPFNDYGIRFYPAQQNSISDFWDVRTNSFQVGVWTHFVAIFEENLKTAKVYIDGKIASSIHQSGPDTPNLSTPVRIGMRYDETNPLNGAVDEVRIYNRALSDTEVKSLSTFESHPLVSIANQPANITVNLAASASISVGVANVSSYQWRKYGYDIVGATNSILTFTNVQPVDLGDYQVVVANLVSSLTSSVAKLLIKGVGDGVYQGMSFIPEGSFKMGGLSAPPVHEVFVFEYAIDKFEITKSLWDEVRSWGLTNGYPDLRSGDSYGGGANPVHSISWYDAIQWCNARSEKNGIRPAYYSDPNLTQVYWKAQPMSGQTNQVVPYIDWTSGYRLPTEAEWEKAARGGMSDRLYSWSDSDEISDARLNFNSKIGETTKVGSYPPNAYGLYDISGNVYEWCWDYFGYYTDEFQTNPRGPTAGIKPHVGPGHTTIEFRSYRGGSWSSGADRARVDYRDLTGGIDGWTFEGPNVGSIYLGFRTLLASFSVPKVVLNPKGISVVDKSNLVLVTEINGLAASYRWQKDGIDLVDGGRISGSGSQTLTISGATLADAGQYRLRASNGNGSAVTEAATVTVWVPVSITALPTSLEGLEGSSVQLLAAATGFPAPTFQWFKGATAIAGETNAILELPQFLEVDAGTYSVVASNVVGAVTSSEAVLSYRSALQVSLDGKPVTGIFRTLNPVQVELQFANNEWLMFYTLDGTDPDFASIPYVGPFTISDPSNLRVAAYSPTFAESYVGKELLVRFLKPQIIDWGALPAMQFGESATLNASASSGLPVSVSLVSGPATWAGGTLKALGAGTVVLRAIQSGDDVFAPVTSEKTLTIDPATQVLAWPTLVEKQFGNPTFGVQVSAASGLPVGLKIISGKATVQGTNVTLSGAGEVILGATQAGTANYQPISEQRSFTVAKAEQTLTMASVANRGFSTQSFIPAAASSSGLPVAFSVLSGPAQVVAGGVQLTGVGTVVLRASQSGNDDYVAAVPVDRTFTVSKGDQTLSFDSVGSKTFNDAAVTLNAKSSVGLPVTFRVISGPGTLSGTQLTFTGAGTLLLQVLQAGNENYNTAAASQTVVVGKAGQGITFPALANLGYSTNVIPLNATTSSGLAVSYRVVQGVATVTSAGLVLKAVGNVSVAADQTGNTNYLATASVTNSFVVSRGDQVITFVPVGDQVLGSAPVTLKATNSTGLPVLFQLLDGPATLSGAVLTLLGEGTVTLRAKQLGSPLYSAAQVDQTFVIRKLNTLTVTQSRGGSVTVDSIKDNYSPTETVTLSVKVDPGFEFVGWTGALSGNQNPAQLVMSANRTIAPQFKDVAAPSLTWNSPVAGNTGDERFTLSGIITDNLGVTSATWSRDGGLPKALVLDSSGRFTVENELLQVGRNTLSVTTLDAAGNKTTQDRVVVWVPQRVLQIVNAAQVQEGRRIVLPMTLSSDADNVAGLNFRVIYNPSFLTDPQLEWGSLVGQSVNSVNASIPGEVSGSFALAGVGLPTGTNLIATLNFRARSVPNATNVVVNPVIVGLGSPSGTLLTRGNATVAGQASIKPRRIKGDNNANDRLDIGDAVVISRLQVGLEEVRLWDRPLNDLNANGDLDNGDIIKALRTVVGLDPQPSPGSEGKRLAMALGFAEVLVNTNDAMAIELLDGPKATVGQPYRVAVRLNRVKGSVSGLSFALKYPANLTLSDKQVGALVPGDALPFWNESSGQVSLAAIRSTTWANATGVAAVLTFVPSTGFSAQAEWPLKLEQVEITGSGFDVRPVDSVAVTIQSGGGTVNTPPQISLQPPTADGSMTLEILATQGATVAVETTGDLNTWVETQQVTAQGNSTPVKVTLQTDPNVQAKFWRVRVR